MALTQTPCTVFGNNHHKVFGVYQWIKELNYIQFVSSIDEAYAQIEQMYYMVVDLSLIKTSFLS